MILYRALKRKRDGTHRCAMGSNVQARSHLRFAHPPPSLPAVGTLSRFEAREREVRAMQITLLNTPSPRPSPPFRGARGKI